MVSNKVDSEKQASLMDAMLNNPIKESLAIASVPTLYKVCKASLAVIVPDNLRLYNANVDAAVFTFVDTFLNLNFYALFGTDIKNMVRSFYDNYLDTPTLEVEERGNSGSYMDKKVESKSLEHNVYKSAILTAEKMLFSHYIPAGQLHVIIDLSIRDYLFNPAVSYFTSKYVVDKQDLSVFSNQTVNDIFKSISAVNASRNVDEDAVISLTISHYLEDFLNCSPSLNNEVVLLEHGLQEELIKQSSEQEDKFCHNDDLSILKLNHSTEFMDECS